MLLNHIKRELQNFKSPLYRNSIYISLASLTTAVAGFLFWAIAARLYPAEDVGVASAVVSAMNLTFQLSMLGMNFAIIRFYPQHKERVVGSALVTTMVASVIFSTGYGLLMMHMESLKKTFTPSFLAAFVIFSIVGTAYNIFFTYAITRRKAEHSFAQSLFFAGRFALLFLMVPLGALGIVSSFGFGLLLGLSYAVLFIGIPQIRVDRKIIREVFHFSLGNYIANIANLAPNYLMPTLVLSMLGKEEAAYFYIAFSIGNLILFVPRAINTSFFVEGSHGLTDLRKTLRKAILLSYVYLTIVNLIVWFLGELILGLFGEDYTSALTLLRLLVVGGFFVVALNFAITILNIQRRVRVIAEVNILKATLFLGASYILMPSLGIMGVGVSWILAHSVVAIIVCFLGACGFRIPRADHET